MGNQLKKVLSFLSATFLIFVLFFSFSTLVLGQTEAECGTLYTQYVNQCDPTNGTKKDDVNYCDNLWANYQTKCEGVITAGNSPSIIFTASPTTINLGQSSILTWSSSYSTSCVASGAWAGSKNILGGTQTVTPIKTSVYTLTCTGTGGEDVEDVTITAYSSTTENVIVDDKDDTTTVSEDVYLPNPISGINTLEDFIKKILEIVVTLGIPVLVLVFIYIGFLYVTAQGDPGKLKKAHEALLWAVVGAAIILGAWILAQAIAGTVNSIKSQVGIIIKILV